MRSLLFMVDLFRVDFSYLSLDFFNVIRLSSVSPVLMLQHLSRNGKTPIQILMTILMNPKEKLSPTKSDLDTDFREYPQIETED